MITRDIVVIGASAGGVTALPELIAGLPEDLGAAVFVVMHMSAASDYLPKRFNRVGKLPAALAVDGEPIRKNRIYCAVADRHLMLEQDRVRLANGPRESHARPSIDVLFRSAALDKRERVIGVVLTGMLDDGTAGLWSIKDRGGLAIVQSPDEAAYPSMPQSARRHVRVDHVLRLEEIPKQLVSLVKTPVAATEAGMSDEKLRIENRIALGDNAFELGVRNLGDQSFYTCPDCHGSMVAIRDGSFTRYRCHTGHGTTARNLAEQGRENIEQTLWAALAQLEEREVVLKEIERTMRDQPGTTGEADMCAGEHDNARQFAARLRDLLTDPALRQDPRRVAFEPSDGAS